MIEQGSEAWFELRKGLATGSHFADVMAKGRGNAESATRENYKFKLANELASGRLSRDSFQGNKHTERGKDLEPIARMRYEAATGAMVEEVDFIKHKYLACGVSPDGLVGADGLVEIKSPLPKIHWGYLLLPQGTPPSEYAWQIMGQLWVTERQWCDFVSYCEDTVDGLQLHINRIYRDEKLIAELEAGVSKFMAEVKVLSREILELEKQRTAVAA